MVKGFKDRNGKFHPINQGRVGKTRYAKVRYSNGAGSAQILEKENRDFANKIKQRYNQFKANQDEKFQKDIDLRRKFQNKLITAFRQARAQNVREGRDLEKFVRQQIPDLPRDKGIEKFVKGVLRDFVRQEARLEKVKVGKSEEEKQKLQDSFEQSLKQSEVKFREAQVDQNKKFRDESEKREKKQNAEIEKLEKKVKDKEDAERQAEKDADEVRKKVKQGASQPEQASAEAKADASEKKAEQQAKEETTFADQVAEELQKDKQEAKTEDFSFGFPEEVI